MITPGPEIQAPEGPGTLRVVFLGTPEFAVPILRALQDSPVTEVVLVVTQPDRPAGRGQRLSSSAVKRFAGERNLPVFQPERLRGPEVIARLRAADADLFVIAAYGQILRQAVLEIPPIGCLNVHPSLLPRHRGPSPIAAAVLAGDEQTGVTVMLTDRGMDTGPILTQVRTPIGREETTASLSPRLAALGADLLLRTVPAWARREIVPMAQNNDAATTSRLFTKTDGAIDWARPAIDLERQVRALNPWPRAFTFARGKRLVVTQARAIEESVSGPPGTLAKGSSNASLVATGEGTLRLDRVQPEGGREITGQQFLGNNRDLVGERLGAG